MEDTNDIRDVLEQVHIIQTRLGDFNGRLRRGPILLKTQEGNVQKANEKLEKMKGEHRALLAEAKSREQEVQAHGEAIARRKAQLQEAKTNKEYQALQVQIEADEATRDILDDEALDAIEQAERFALKLPPVEAELKKLQELYDTTKSKFFADKPHIEAEVAEYTRQLQDEEAKISSTFREVYDRLVRSVGGENVLAVVVDQKYCGGCNHQIPVNSLAHILAKKPVTCSSCARLLYVPADFQFDKG